MGGDAGVCLSCGFLAVFVAGVWLMRAAGCVVNDYAVVNLTDM